MPPFLPIALFALGAFLGSAVNFLTYRQRMQPRPISPWMGTGADARLNRHWFDRIPIFGWLSLRREASIHGPGFWIRPLLVELLMGMGAMALYRYEVLLGSLLPATFPRPFPPGDVLFLQCQFAAHLVLLFWMTVASLIDADETIIPDSITISGTFFGLAFAAFCPWSLLPVVPFQPGVLRVDFLQVTSPNAWPVWLDSPNTAGLFIGIGCWLLGCFAILHRTWYPRHGLIRAVQLCWVRVRREPSSRIILPAALLGMAVLVLFWHRGGPHWAGLLTSLVGMAVGGGIVWAVRIIGSAAMRREAMGFGDVTLMAMIGTFVGWQTCLMIFFLAPFAALAIGLIRLLLIREREIPYGPFLCLATLGVILCWDTLWDRMLDVFALGWLVPVAVLACFAMMPLLLGGLRWITGLFDRR